MTNAEFCELWQRAESLAAVVEASGLKYNSCKQRASNLRKAGVPLKRFGPGRKTDPNKVAKLKAIVLETDTEE